MWVETSGRNVGTTRDGGDGPAATESEGEVNGNAEVFSHFGRERHCGVETFHDVSQIAVGQDDALRLPFGARSEADLSRFRGRLASPAGVKPTVIGVGTADFAGSKNRKSSVVVGCSQSHEWPAAVEAAKGLADVVGRVRRNESDDGFCIWWVHGGHFTREALTIVVRLGELCLGKRCVMILRLGTAESAFIYQALMARSIRFLSRGGRWSVGLLPTESAPRARERPSPEPADDSERVEGAVKEKSSNQTKRAEFQCECISQSLVRTGRWSILSHLAGELSLTRFERGWEKALSGSFSVGSLLHE